MNNTLQLTGESGLTLADQTYSVQDIVQKVQLVKQVMDAVMKDGTHYGVIPGTSDKPTLLKPGAETLSVLFRLDPQFLVETIDQGNGHIQYMVTTVLTHIPTGVRWGSGLGSATTMESKWRYRTGPVEWTDNPVPKEYWDLRKSDPDKAQSMIGGRGHTVRKHPDTGKWVVCIQGEKIENPNIADVYNTALKIAKKRSLVDAVLTVTGASDLFTQDLEDSDVAVNVVETVAPAPVKTATAGIMPQEKSDAVAPAPDAPAPGNGNGGDTHQDPRTNIRTMLQEIVSHLNPDNQLDLGEIESQMKSALKSLTKSEWTDKTTGEKKSFDGWDSIDGITEKSLGVVYKKIQKNYAEITGKSWGN